MTKERLNEINTTIETLRRAWITHSELRLGQLILNSVSEGLFYMEDSIFREHINLFARQFTSDKGK